MSRIIPPTILLLLMYSFSYGQSNIEKIDIFGVEFILLNNRELTYKNNSSSIRTVQIQEMKKNTMSFSSVEWKNRMNITSEEKILLTDVNSEVSIVVCAEYANNKEISFEYKLRDQLTD